MILAVLSLLMASMSSSEAIAVMLNTSNAVDVKTFGEARKIVERDAAEGKVLQQFVVGVTTDNKELAERYLNASRDKIRTLAEQNDNPLAWYLLSVDRNDRECLRKAADGGNVQALNALGMLLLQEARALPASASNEVERCLADAHACFRDAALKRDPNGYVNLGSCYLKGDGCRKDLRMSFTCFEAAAEAGHPEGMDILAACYRWGRGVKANDEKNFYWRMRASAARGNDLAAKWLELKK